MLLHPLLIAMPLFTANSHLEMQYIPADAEVVHIPLHILYPICLKKQILQGVNSLERK